MLLASVLLAARFQVVVDGLISLVVDGDTADSDCASQSNNFAHHLDEHRTKMNNGIIQILLNCGKKFEDVL